MNKLTAEKRRDQFQKWWESFYETSPREAWDDIYSPEHDYYLDEGIDGQYDAWKASRQALEIALPVLEQQEKDNYGWIKWGGGENPAEGKLVQVEFRDGFIDDAQYSGNYRWYHEPNNCDIIAYRVVQQERERGEGE